MNLDNIASKPKQGFLLGLVIGIAVVGILSFVGVFLLISGGNDKSDVANNAVVVSQSQNQPTPTGPTGTPAAVVGADSFQEKTGAQICEEDGKPVVYMFGTSVCPHCVWLKDAFDSVAKKYIDEGKIVAYHWELDRSDDLLTAATETSVPANQEAVYTEFNPEGTVPTLVFGCKYYRVGTAHERDGLGVDGEKAEFEALIKELLK